MSMGKSENPYQWNVCCRSRMKVVTTRQRSHCVRRIMKCLVCGGIQHSEERRVEPDRPARPMVKRKPKLQLRKTDYE